MATRTASRSRARTRARRQPAPFFGRKFAVWVGGSMFLLVAWKAPDYIVPIALLTLALVIGGVVQDFLPRRFKAAVPLVVLVAVAVVVWLLSAGRL